MRLQLQPVQKTTVSLEEIVRATPQLPLQLRHAPRLSDLRDRLQPQVQLQLPPHARAHSPRHTLRTAAAAGCALQLQLHVLCYS